MAPQVFNIDFDNELLYNDGEGLDFNDLNDMQRLMRRLMIDGYLQHRFIGPIPVANEVRPFGRALAIQAPGGSMVVTVLGGAILEYISAATQPEYSTLLHALPASGQAITIDAADAVNPRWDIITVKLAHFEGGSEARDFEDAATRELTSPSTNKRRYNRLTITYTPGTPAGSPAEPSPPAGEVRIARVEVAALAATIDDTNIVDYRKPAGMRRYSIPLTTWWSDSGTFGSSGEQPSWGISSSGEINVPLWIPWAQETQNAAYANANMRLAELWVVYQRPGPSAGFTYEVKAIDQGSWLGAPAPGGVDVSAPFSVTGSFARAFVDMDAFDPLWLGGQRSAQDEGTLVDPAVIFQHAYGSGGAHDLVNVVVGWWGL